MKNTDKLLRAFIDAMGYEVEEGDVTAGNLIDNRKSSAVYSTKEIKQLYPNKHVCTESFGGNWIVSEPVTDYKVTKSGKDNRLMNDTSKTLNNRLEVSVKANKDLMDKNRRLQQLLVLHLKGGGLNYSQIAKELSVTPTVVKNYFRKVDRVLQREMHNENI